MEGELNHLASARERLLLAACDVFRSRGLQAVSMRAAAEQAGRHVSSVQLQFRDHDQFLRAVIRYWGDEVTRSLTESIVHVSGLARTLRLCEAWVAHPDSLIIPMEAIRLGPRKEGGVSASAMFLDVLDEWLTLTHRTLKQARLKKEIVSGADLARLTNHLHRLVWSRGWDAALSGVNASGRSILRSVWELLGAVATDPGQSLPTLEDFLGEPKPDAPTRPPIDPASLPVWHLLGPGSTLYQAYVRFEREGKDLSTWGHPKVEPQDRAAAEAYVAKHGSSLPPEEA